MVLVDEGKEERGNKGERDEEGGELRWEEGETKERWTERGGREKTTR